MESLDPVEERDIQKLVKMLEDERVIKKIRAIMETKEENKNAD